MSNQQKTYAWNRNAATHREAIIKFSGISFMATLPLNIPTVILAIAAINNDNVDNVRSVAILVPVIHMAAWMILLTFMCAIYHMMNTTTERPLAPSPTRDKPAEIWISQEAGKWNIVREKDGRGTKTLK